MIATLVLGVGLGVAFGSFITEAEVFPYSLVRPVTDRAVDLYKRISDPESYALLNVPLSE
ncbi:MAG: hypothetical protein QGG67_09390 [Gammaproteobacteria bacterium]|nr:hypothetical protein [Chromatiales bacterium]MDP6096184.1 hypothetical protein [Gammaproteobacteria bacterium]HJP04839.1 hypothetical protein [Gammaproteobacteria bacterium]